LRTLLPLTILSLALFAGSAQATSFLFDNCDSQGCQGVTASIDVTDNGGSFDVVIVVNADNYTGQELGLNQLGFNAIKNWSSVSLISADGNFNPAVAANVSSAGLCKNGSNTGKVCTSGFVDITGGGDYTFEFLVVGGTALTATDIHFGGQFANSAAASKGKLISASLDVPVPEPSAAVAFATGLVVVAGTLRRRR